MISIEEKKNCCGCSACASVCPVQCISMKEDYEGFLYPFVNKSKCVNCGLCEKVCNHINPYDKKEPLKILAAANKDEEVRFNSSSGGIFYILAEQTINKGGVVFGARFDENWQVVIDYADTIEGVKAFMGSKYVQARIETAYIDAKRFLINGRKVLFSGTPCQIAGLHKFLGRQYDNLLSIDFICHGVPSPKVWKMYLENITDTEKLVKAMSFRNKINGWKHLHFSITYNVSEKTITLLCPASENQYMNAFLSDLILRPSCSSCKVKSCSSQSDITLADFWGIWNINSEMSDDKGTSLLLVNTEKGVLELPSDEYVRYAKAQYDSVKTYNKAYIISVTPHPKREVFFEQLQKTNNVIKLIDKTLAPSFGRQCKKRLKQLKELIVCGGGIFQNESNVIKNPKIISIVFRSKIHGWKGYQIEIIVQ